METWIGIVLTVVGLLMGINQYRLNDIVKTILANALRLDERISEETSRLDKDISEQSARLDNNIAEQSKHYLSELNGVATRLGSQIQNLSDGVIYKDVFEQHEKVQDTRYSFIEKTFNALEEQAKSGSASNTREHDRLSKKMDDMPGVIRDEIDRSNRRD